MKLIIAEKELSRLKDLLHQLKAIITYASVKELSFLLEKYNSALTDFQNLKIAVAITEQQCLVDGITLSAAKIILENLEIKIDILREILERDFPGIAKENISGLLQTCLQHWEVLTTKINIVQLESELVLNNS